MSNRSRLRTAGEILAAFEKTPVARTLRERLVSGSALSLNGISGAGQSMVAALLHRWDASKPVVLVAETLKAQETLLQDLETWMGCNRPIAPGPEAPSKSSAAETDPRPRKARAGKRESAAAGAARAPSGLDSGIATVAGPWFFPPWDTLPHEGRLPHPDVISDRLQTLLALARGRREGWAPVIVTSVAALMQRTFKLDQIEKHTRRLEPGESLDPLDLVEWLEEVGYEPEAQVTQKGELSLRGGILDVFPLASAWPVRIEFFGDEIESLREFDPRTQVSRQPVEVVWLSPAGELGLLKRWLESERDSSGASSPDSPGSFEAGAALVELIPAEARIVWCEPGAVEEQAVRYQEQIPADDPFFVSWADLREGSRARSQQWIELSEAPDDSGGMELPNLEAFRPIAERPADPQVADAQRREFFDQLARWIRQSYEVCVFFNNTGERDRFEEVWRELRSDPATAAPGAALGALSRGFLSHEGRMVVVTDAEIFGRYRMQRPRRLRQPHAAAMRSGLEIDFGDLQEGDYVVHVQHGIGIYRGLQMLPMASGRRRGSAAAEAAGQEAMQECLTIEYAASDPDQAAPRLYVPVSEAHLVGKYIGVGRVRPPLNTLGGVRWQRAKEQAEEAVRDLASEFLSIQAAREAQPGHPFPADTAWQREFEGSFLYEETPDQLRAIDQAKRDMESPKPMDRLICGDVGFGKTEVAIRAAFKAVMGGKQVAVMVPTTVLAQQHYNTFRERMADYPVRIDLLSRFRTRREQQRTVEALAAGAVDIVIGTHRLVQDDVVFRDLGLVVIDEEQRFGVTHKERFKQLRRMVDVLTLSATPIPRTLYMALTGARDMSTIETPPVDRLPVETVVTGYDERIIRDAIVRELNRGGQVFFLHNRVGTIDVMAQKLKTLVPQARMVIGHGQMGSDDLEEVMTRFVNGEADVLLSTTIIESGIDIPNANTIIIDRADRFGLSDLYQLRGRVGRYKHQAYAYLLLPRHAGLLADARKRISAIRQYSSLGSGFKIAMRDLEIRGAGNLLGAEQSGHITAVGFELYCQLLKQSVAVLKGERPPRRVEVVVRLDFLSLAPMTNAGGGGDTPEADEKEVRAPSIDAASAGPGRGGGGGELKDRGGAEGEPSDAAYVPLSYVGEPRQRIEIYRRLAQLGTRAEVEVFRGELRDRFGPVPDAMERLLVVAELKILASERGVTVIETREDRLMLTRNNDYIMVGGRFPRLTKPTPKARLAEIRKYLTVL